MRTREEILASWNSMTSPLRDKVNEFWLELFLDIRDLAGVTQPGDGLLAELEAIHAAVDAALPGIGTKLDSIVDESKKIALGQEQTADMLKDCLTKIIKLLEKIAGK